MQTQVTQSDTLKNRLESIKSAFEQGKLEDYAPLRQSGHNAMQSTCMTAWGPAMRR
jgi:hypothetical protein